MNCRILVQESTNCIKLAEFIDKNIKNINKLGLFVIMEKIEKEDMEGEFLESLKKKGITRLPALINGKEVCVGMQTIIDYFKNYGEGGEHAEYSKTSNLDSWMNSQIMMGLDRDGKPTDGEDCDSDGEKKPDFNKKMREFDRRRPSRTAKGTKKKGSNRAKFAFDDNDPDEDPEEDDRRKPRRGVEEEEEEEPVAKKSKGKREPIRYDDNIADDDERSGKYKDSEDALDNKMMSAWMDNNAAE